MKHVKLISIKWIASFILLYLILGIAYGMSLGQIFTISLLSFATYYIGDILILERTNNFIATIADLVVNFTAIALLLDMMNFVGDIWMAAFASAVAITIYEIFFHLYIAEDKNETSDYPIQAHRYNYMSELSEEWDYLPDDFDEFY